MAASTRTTYAAMVRSKPVRHGLLSLGPLALAVVQLLNSYVHGLPLGVALAFAALMASFSVLLAQYQVAEYRLGQLEKTASTR